MTKFSDANLIFILLSIGLVWLLVPNSTLLVCLVSYTYHLLNLHAYITRTRSAGSFLAQSLLFRIVSFATLGYLLAPYAIQQLRLPGVAIFLIGTFLHFLSVWTLGLRRTYYSHELGQTPPATVSTFPYNVLGHPMATGSLLQFVGVLLMNHEFQQSYGYLIYGHLFLTLVTLLVEHFDIHFADHFFAAKVGSFADLELRREIDGLREWCLETYRSDLHASCSMHRYVKKLPQHVVAEVDKVRFANRIVSAISDTFPASKVVPLPMTDELYISRYNYDRGGDQGLFDKHHDGNLRFMPGVSVVRSLIYLSSEDNLSVVFETSNVRASMKTYNFGLLDFHKELHWVDGSYDPDKPPRILLKCNYLIDHLGWTPYRLVCIQLNVAVFYLVKAAMEYSKSPKTLFQRLVGLLCNAFRLLNNVNPIAPAIVVLLVVVISIRAVHFSVAGSY